MIIDQCPLVKRIVSKSCTFLKFKIFLTFLELITHIVICFINVQSTVFDPIFLEIWS